VRSLRLLPLWAVSKKATLAPQVLCSTTAQLDSKRSVLLQAKPIFAILRERSSSQSLGPTSHTDLSQSKTPHVLAYPSQ